MKSSEMRKVFERWKSSGLSLKAFGEREGIAYAKLLYWRKKFRGESGDGAATADLARVQVVPDPVATSPRPEQVGVWLPNGVSLDVPLGLDEAELARLVRVLSTC